MKKTPPSQVPVGEKTWIKIISVSVVVILYALFAITIRSYLPETAKLIEIVTTIYKTVGYPLVYFSALGEATFPVGMYFPGSTIVMLGTALSRTGQILWINVYLCAVAGCMSGYCLNYVLGRYGWLRFLRVLGLEKGLDEAKKKLAGNEKKSYLFGYMSATTGAFLSSAAGVMHIPFKRFFFWTLLSQSFWSAVWGGIVYVFGYVVVEIFLKYLIFIIWGSILVYLVKVYLFKSKQL